MGGEGGPAIQMKIAIFYHCRLSGGEPPINADHAIGIMESQMAALKSTGLANRADHFVIGSNGDTFNYITASILAPDKATVVNHGEDAAANCQPLPCFGHGCPDTKTGMCFIITRKARATGTMRNFSNTAGGSVWNER